MKDSCTAAYAFRLNLYLLDAGLDVLAGLAESALTEQQRAEESADPLPLDIKIPRPQSAATANQDTARPQPSREPASSHQRQHLGIPTFSQPMTSGQPHLYSKGSGLSQAAPSGVFNTGVPGQFPPTAFRQPNHSSLLPEHLQSAVLQASRQQQSQIQQQTLPQSRPYSAGSLSGRGQTQGPMPPQDHPSAVLWKGGGSDTIIRPQAVRSTGFPIPTYTQPHHASVAALHSKPVGALSPGSPTSVMQRSVQGLQGSAQHPLDPSPASTDSASGATAATAEQQTSLKSVAAPDGIAAAAPTGKDVSKSQHAAAPASQAQAAHPLLPSQATSEVCQMLLQCFLNRTPGANKEWHTLLAVTEALSS